MTDFEKVLQQYEPMISATIRQLHIYRDFEQFRQAGRIALWQAWTRFDSEKGNFTPFAHRSIRGALLDEMKRENRFFESSVPIEDEHLEFLQVNEQAPPTPWTDNLSEAIEQLQPEEGKLLHWLFVDQLTQAECARRIGITVAGVKKRRERVLAKLRGEVAR
ncbi:sigma-70 family RNA polymerase sigma factor [Sporosarcina sp. 179-K 3D1 HS]|uniref:sigma-70 family RNA polymerase sigma factor n=1 Tax=Sporosarcina sp. 179-K 3D1 HS TaxID=3232169 RepID=UPI0039A089F1